MIPETEIPLTEIRQTLSAELYYFVIFIFFALLQEDQ